MDATYDLSAADRLLVASKYEEAYAAYERVSIQLMKSIADTRTSRMVSKGAGWVAAFLTGGFGIEDLVIVPAVNKMLLSVLGIDLESVLRYLYYSNVQKLMILSISPDLVNSRAHKEVLLAFLVTYKLTEHGSEAKLLEQLYDLVNPLIDSTRVNGLEGRLTKDQIRQKLMDETKKQSQQVAVLNGFLFLYLQQSGLTDGPLFAFLWNSFEECPTGDEASDIETERSYAGILGLKGKVTRDVIKTKYRDLMMRHHPDRFPNASEDVRSGAEERVKVINKAYAWFRRKYNM